jgi:hypothetical protein
MNQRPLLMALMTIHMTLPAAALAENPPWGRSGGPAADVSTVDYPQVSGQLPPPPGDAQPSTGGYAQPYPAGTASGGGFPPLDYAPPSAGPAPPSDTGQGGYGATPPAGTAAQAPTTRWTERETQRPRSPAPGYPQSSPGPKPGQYPSGGATGGGRSPSYPGPPAPSAGRSYPSGPSAGAQGGDYGRTPDASQYAPLEPIPEYEQPAPRGGYEQYRGEYTPSRPHDSGAAQQRQQPAGAPPAGGWQTPAWPYPGAGGYGRPPPYPPSPYPGGDYRRRRFDMPFFPFSW